MIQNLQEGYLYDFLPDGVLTLDEQGLIQAVVCGVQDRIEDLRSFGKNMQLFFTANNFPQTGNNAVLVDLTTAQGKAYTRSLDIQDDTPEDGTAALTAWAAAQLGVALTDVSNVRYGVDLLRLVDADVLSLLAATVGAVIYQTSMVPASEQQQETQHIVSTYFPRLQIKGTTQSFDILGRILGFDDVRVTPLWARLSSRQPYDIGAAANDPDFATKPLYQPEQSFGALYDPLKTNDGPFYAWSGTVNNGTASTQFYTEVVNGFSPFINVVVLGVTSAGTVINPANGTYVLGASGSQSVGGPHKKAYAYSGTGSVLFEAVAEGDSFNGMVVHVADAGTNKLISMMDRLSAIKYRSSYFDIGLAADMDRIEEIFGSSSAQRNKDLAADPTLTADGTAVSPFRSWVSGSISTGFVSHDFTVQVGTTASMVVVPRQEASAVDRQLNMDSLVAAGVQVTQAFDEVRAATRTPRRALSGFLLKDNASYAAYGTAAVLFSTNGSALYYSGSYAYAPLPSYTAAIDVVTSNGTVSASAEIVATNQSVYFYEVGDFAGIYNFATGTYAFVVGSAATGTRVVARWSLASTEVIRSEPSYTDKSTGTVAYQARPEDHEDTELRDEVVDDYPWRRDLVGGGELIELDAYLPNVPDIGVDIVDTLSVVQTHTGVDVDVIGVPSPATGMLRLLFQDRPVDATYSSGQVSTGYTGMFKDLSALTAQELALINTENDLETLFNPGFSVYIVGLVQGVFVADLPKFFGPHHRDGLVGWMPFNEHPEDDLSVIDHSAIASPSVLVGVSPLDRAWSDERGWYLSLQQNGTASFNKYRGLADKQSMSFWMNPSLVAGTGTTTFMQLGPLSFDLDNAASTVFAYAGTLTPIGPVRMLVGSGTAVANQWSYFYVCKDSASAVFGSNANLGTSATEIEVDAEFLSAGTNDLQLTVKAESLAYGIHDLRIWDEDKSQADMDLVRYHNPTPTICNYRLGFLRTTNEEDRYGYRVMPNGFVTPDVMPAWLRSVRMGRVRRYDSMGVYGGESRYKEVGLGGGRPLPSTYLLGNQFTMLVASGTTVMATTHGEMPGENALWLDDSYAGTYAILSASGSASGTNADYSWSGAAEPFPNCMAETNPNRDLVWIVGDDANVYEVSLFGSLTSTQLVASFITRDRSDADLEVNRILQVFNSSGSVFAMTAQGTIYPGQLQISVVSGGTIVSTSTNGPTGEVDVITNGTSVVEILHPLDFRRAEQPTGVQVILSGSSKTLSVSSVGTVYQKAWSGTLVTPPLYMYLNERIVADAPNAWQQWTDNTNTGNFGNKQVPPVAALDQNGVLEFQNTGSLVAGLYELTVVSGNSGKTDPDFRGFKTQITVNTAVLQETLAAGASGYNQTGTDTFQFTVLDSVVGDWLLSFDWTNQYADSQKGTARRLVIYSYQIRHLTTELYRVEIAPSGSAPLLTLMTTA